MNESKHTPLPWRRVQGVVGSDFVGPDGGLVISGVYGEEDADYVDRAVNTHEELVKWMDILLVTARGPGINEFGGKEFRLAVLKARAALAKVTGETT